MIKVGFKIKKYLIFGGHGVRKQKSKIYGVTEDFQIQNFGNTNTLIYCQVHCGSDRTLFTALSSIDFQINGFKNSPAA